MTPPKQLGRQTTVPSTSSTGRLAATVLVEQVRLPEGQDRDTPQEEAPQEATADKARRAECSVLFRF